MSRDVMTAGEVARYLSVSRSKIYEMVKDGEVPHLRLGTRIRFPRSAVDRWLAERTHQPERTLLDEFELLYEKFHLKKFLRAKGIAYGELSDQELLKHLKVAIAELRSYERAEAERRRLLSEDEQ